MSLPSPLYERVWHDVRCAQQLLDTLVDARRDGAAARTRVLLSRPVRVLCDEGVAYVAAVQLARVMHRLRVDEATSIATATPLTTLAGTTAVAAVAAGNDDDATTARATTQTVVTTTTTTTTTVAAWPSHASVSRQAHAHRAVSMTPCTRRNDDNSSDSEYDGAIALTACVQVMWPPHYPYAPCRWRALTTHDDRHVQHHTAASAATRTYVCLTTPHDSDGDGRRDASLSSWPSLLQRHVHMRSCHDDHHESDNNNDNNSDDDDDDDGVAAVALVPLQPYEVQQLLLRVQQARRRYDNNDDDDDSSSSSSNRDNDDTIAGGRGNEAARHRRRVHARHARGEATTSTPYDTLVRDCTPFVRDVVALLYAWQTTELDVHALAAHALQTTTTTRELTTAVAAVADAASAQVWSPRGYRRRHATAATTSPHTSLSSRDDVPAAAATTRFAALLLPHGSIVSWSVGAMATRPPAPSSSLSLSLPSPSLSPRVTTMTNAVTRHDGDTAMRATCHRHDDDHHTCRCDVDDDGLVDDTSDRVASPRLRFTSHNSVDSSISGGKCTSARNDDGHHGSRSRRRRRRPLPTVLTLPQTLRATRRAAAHATWSSLCLHPSALDHLAATATTATSKSSSSSSSSNSSSRHSIAAACAALHANARLCASLGLDVEASLLKSLQYLADGLTTQQQPHEDEDGKQQAQPYSTDAYVRHTLLPALLHTVSALQQRQRQPVWAGVVVCCFALPALLQQQQQDTPQTAHTASATTTRTMHVVLSCLQQHATRLLAPVALLERVLGLVAAYASMCEVRLVRTALQQGHTPMHGRVARTQGVASFSSSSCGRSLHEHRRDGGRHRRRVPALTECAVCGLPLRPHTAHASSSSYEHGSGCLVVQCVRCGHGGHAEHMIDWWKDTTVRCCPKGCDCVCVY